MIKRPSIDYDHRPVGDRPPAAAVALTTAAGCCLAIQWLALLGVIYSGIYLPPVLLAVAMPLLGLAGFCLPTFADVKYYSEYHSGFASPVAHINRVIAVLAVFNLPCCGCSAVVAILTSLY